MNEEVTWVRQRLAKAEVDAISKEEAADIVRMQEVVEHLVACLRGIVPECLTCLDTESLACQSGFYRCDDCK